MTCVVKAQKSNNSSISEKIEEVKIRRKNDYDAFKCSKSGKTNKEVCETTTILGQYPSNATVIVGESIINGIREKRLSGKNGVVEVRNFAGVTIEDIHHNSVLMY